MPESADTTRPTTPAQAWAALHAGNQRFISGAQEHPNQDADTRRRLAAGQKPFATVFGCSDSREPMELLFDQGLGDLFVVRTAGHVLDPTVLGSLAFGVEILSTPLLVVLGHATCGGVGATLSALESGVQPPGYLRDIVERITPSVIAAHRAGITEVKLIEYEHVRQTCELIADRAPAIGAHLKAGKLAIVGAHYDLAEGAATPVCVIGDAGDLGLPDGD